MEHEAYVISPELRSTINPQFNKHYFAPAAHTLISLNEDVSKFIRKHLKKIDDDSKEWSTLLDQADQADGKADKLADASNTPGGGQPPGGQQQGEQQAGGQQAGGSPSGGPGGEKPKLAEAKIPTKGPLEIPNALDMETIPEVQPVDVGSQKSDFRGFNGNVDVASYKVPQLAYTPPTRTERAASFGYRGGRGVVDDDRVPFTGSPGSPSAFPANDIAAAGAGAGGGNGNTAPGGVPAGPGFDGSAVGNIGGDGPYAPAKNDFERAVAYGANETSGGGSPSSEGDSLFAKAGGVGYGGAGVPIGLADPRALARAARGKPRGLRRLGVMAYVGGLGELCETEIKGKATEICSQTAPYRPIELPPSTDKADKKVSAPGKDTVARAFNRIREAPVRVAGNARLAPVAAAIIRTEGGMPVIAREPANYSRAGRRARPAPGK